MSNSAGCSILRKHLLILFFLHLALSLPPLQAQGTSTPKLYSIDRASARLREINPANAQTVSSVTLTLTGRTISGGTGLAAEPGTGKLFALLRLTGFSPETPSVRELVTIDPATGVVTDIGVAGGNNNMAFADLAFDAGGVLYGVTGDNSPNLPEQMFILNKTTGGATPFMSLGNGNDGESLAFNTDNGFMYHASGKNELAVSPPPPDLVFESINLTTHTVQPRINLSGAPIHEASSLVYAGSNTFLWASLDFFESNVFQLVRVTTSGVVSFVGTLDHVPTGLAFWSPAVNQNVPVLPPNSLVNGASFRAATDPNGAVAPGTIVSVFGSNLTDSTRAATSVPLPTTLGDTSVLVNGLAAPLFLASAGQINMQMPYEIPAGTANVQVRRGTQTSAIQPLTVGSAVPGIFTVNQQGTGQGAVLLSNTGTFAAPANSIPGREARPANRGEFISIYCSGLGDVSNRPASGSGASGNPLSLTLMTPSITFGTGTANAVTVSPAFSGLTAFVGLYQVDVQIPANAPTGGAVPLSLTINGVPSNTVTIAVQ